MKNIFNAQKKTILEQKQERLVELESKSASALSLVTSTIEGLGSINQEIEDTLLEVKEIKSQCDKVEEGLSKKRDQNKKIISKFKALIED